jgi:hypothetical protein
MLGCVKKRRGGENGLVQADGSAEKESATKRRERGRRERSDRLYTMLWKEKRNEIGSILCRGRKRQMRDARLGEIDSC